MVFEHCNCSFLIDKPQTLIKQLNCGVSKNIKRRSFSIEFMLAEDVNEFGINMKIQLPRKGQSEFVLLDLKNIEGCKILSNKNQATLVQLGRSTLDRFSNIPHSCPFKKNVLYYIRNFRVDMNNLRIFNFEAEMQVLYDFMLNNKKVFKGFIQGRMYNKLKNKN